MLACEIVNEGFERSLGFGETRLGGVAVVFWGGFFENDVRRALSRYR